MNKELIYKVEKVLSEFEIVLGATETIEGVKESWGITKKELMGLGIEVKADKEAPKNHNEVYAKLADLADKWNETYLAYKEMTVKFDEISMYENGLGESILAFHRNDSADEVASILLKGNKEYEVIENEADHSVELIEK